MNNIEQALLTAENFAKTYAPDAGVSLLAGSRLHNTASDQSDFDVVVLHRGLREGAWREMIQHQGKCFEVFVHDPQTLAYFFEEIERPSGEPALIRMVIEGQPVLNRDKPLLSAALSLAEKAFASGPLALPTLSVDKRRYNITDLAEALRASSSSSRTLATGTALYGALADFALRANGRWGASGKSIPAALRSYDPVLEHRFVEAFDELWRQGRSGAVQELVNAVLDPFGGRFREGFKEQAPAGWRRE